MSFTYALTSPLSVRDSIRMLVSDTDSDDQLMQDEEIDTIIFLEVGDITQPYSVHRVAAEVAQQIAGNFSRQGLQQDDRVRVAFEQRAADYRVLADRLLARSRRGGAIPYAGGISQSDKDLVEDDSDRVLPLFSRGMLSAPGVPDSTFPNSGTNLLNELGIG